MSTLPAPPATHPAATTGHIPADSIGPLPPHLSDIGSPARQNSSYSGSPYRGASPHSTSYIPSGSPVGYAAPAATYQSGSPGRYSAAPASAYQPAGSPIGATGPTYEQEVQSFLDQSSPQRVREQSPTVLPSADYMAKAEHEAATNENSPARQRSYAGSPSGYVPSSPPPTYAAPVTTSYAAPAPTSYAAPVSSYHQPPASYVQPSSVVHASTEHIPLVAGSPGHHAATPVPEYPAAGDLHGESPRRVRAFGASHTDPHAPGNEYSPQRVR